MKPGPAFIQVKGDWKIGMVYVNDPSMVRGVKGELEYIEGYIFQPATECTPAGWVRPHGNPGVSHEKET